MTNEQLLAEIERLETQMHRTILDMQLHLSVALEELKNLSRNVHGEIGTVTPFKRRQS